ncbi:unnamed protein product [Allacma fusca]|uniref:Uncharacterized protein n=1 Tax=Allacma fusca TaxID=39272 RepID=A0A8J2KMK6_9HEXA|nr:unnamed protein product [Allacma fusca]
MAEVESMANVSLNDKKPKFKDFTLDQKSMFTTFTDEEVQRALRVLSVKKDDGDFEVVERESPFVDAAIKESERSRTENYAPTFNTSGDPRLDFFFHVLEQTNPQETRRMLVNSWRDNPLHTLKLIAVLRDIRDGKGIRRQYQDCLYWMYIYHPKTLYENLEELLKFGYWKDSLQMLMIILFDGYIHPYLSRDDVGGKSSTSADILSLAFERKRKVSAKGREINHFEEKDLYNKLVAKHYGQKAAAVGKNMMNELRIKFAREKFEKELKYRMFHVRIAQIFASQLKQDMEKMKSGDASDKTVSLAGKWAPSIEAHFDRYTLIGSTVAVELIRILESTKYDWATKPIPIAVYLARKNYHKEFCVPLRKFHQVPEVAMSAGEWDKVNYKRVSSKCMQRNSKFFSAHDNERFTKFLEKPDSKVAGAALKPIEILNRAMNYSEEDSDTDRIVIEKQWESLVEDIKGKGGGLLKNAISVCDVSGSMAGQPMLAAMGLTLITMSMSENPWSDICVTFHEEPILFNIKETLTLSEKVSALQSMPWGGSTDIHAVFKLIVSLGEKNKLPADKMPKILFIFTDMEFNEACTGTSLTNFEAAQKLFAEKGYNMPTIVFWNLRAKANASKTSTPVQINEQGAILLSGFSAQQLAYVMKQEDISKCSPLQFMLDIIESEKYNKLTIHD